LYPDDLEFGELIYESDVRVDKILSVDRKLIRYKVGKVKRYVVDRIKKVLGELIK